MARTPNDVEELARHLHDRVVGRRDFYDAPPTVRTFYRKVARAALEWAKARE